MPAYKSGFASSEEAIEWAKEDVSDVMKVYVVTYCYPHDGEYSEVTAVFDNEHAANEYASESGFSHVKEFILNKAF